MSTMKTGNVVSRPWGHAVLQWTYLHMLLVSVVGCGAQPGDNSNLDGRVDGNLVQDGGPADGGPADGGPADGGPADGGPADGGPADGGGFDLVSVYAVDVSSDLARPCDFTISTSEDWGHVNDSQYEVICVSPGDYTSVSTVSLTAAGSPVARRVLRLEPLSLQGHPILLPEPAQAWVPRLRLNGATHWLIDGLSFRYPTGLQIEIVNGSSDNVINRLNMYGGIDAMVQYLDFRGECNCHRNTVQNSVFGGVSYTADTVCVTLNGFGVYAQMHDNHIVQNEFINCNDAAQIVTDAGNPSGNFEGTIIDQNDMYLTPEYYVDCTTGQLDPTGWCTCAENAVDLKAGSDNPNNPVVISNNRMYGFRDTMEGGVCGTDSSAWGTAADAHFGVKNLVVRGNLIYDANRGL